MTDSDPGMGTEPPPDPKPSASVREAALRRRRWMLWVWFGIAVFVIGGGAATLAYFTVRSGGVALARLGVVEENLAALEGDLAAIQAGQADIRAAMRAAGRVGAAAPACCGRRTGVVARLYQCHLPDARVGTRQYLHRHPLLPPTGTAGRNPSGGRVGADFRFAGAGQVAGAGHRSAHHRVGRGRVRRRRKRPAAALESHRAAAAACD